MPYKVIGNKVYHKKGGKWKVKQRCGSPAKAKRAVNLLRGVEHGDWKPTGRKAKDLRKKSSAKRRSKRGKKPIRKKIWVRREA